MNKKVIFPILFLMLISLSVFVSAIEPMNLRTIKEIKSVNPSDVANLGLGVYKISAQYNLGSYHDGDWLGFENKKCEDQKIGAVWIEFSWERAETDVVLTDGSGNERKIYLPSNGKYFWIAEDGSSYYANSNHGEGRDDLNQEQALVPEHLARQSPSPEQKNPEKEEPLECGFDENIIKLKGQLIDQMTNEPISGAILNSAYKFSPLEVITESNGNFEFIVDSDSGGAWTFTAECYGWADNIGLQKDYELWEDGQLKQTYKFALRKEIFDSEEEVKDVSGKSEVDIGKVYAWPKADISIVSDIPNGFQVMFKYKNLEGYNGGGQSGYTKDHYLSTALPLDYDTFIQFEDEAGNEYKSSTYKIPSTAECGVVSLEYFNGESEWSVLSIVEPTIETGPVKVEVPTVIKKEKPEITSSLCLGCLKDDNCYPLGYRKNGEYCSEDKRFVSQIKSNSFCENNFECSSNVCISGECISESFIQKLISWFENLFG